MTVALDSVVGITDEDGDPYCAGVTWEDARVITAAHCVDGPEAAHSVGFRDTERNGRFDVTFRYTVLYYNQEQDLAILGPLELVATPARSFLATKTPIYGQQVIAVGHPIGLTYSLTEGVISAPRREMSSGQVWMQVSAPLWFGNSGGPVFNRYGEIVGVASFIAGRVPHLGGAVHLEVLRAAASQVH